MSYFPPTIRYEYADESNNSQPSMYADPPLFKEEMPDESHYFLHSTSTNPSLPFPSSSALQQAHDDENLQPSVAAFCPFGIGDTSHDFAHSQPTPSSVDYFFWQSDEPSSSSSACVVDEKRPLMYPSTSQYDDQKQMQLNDRDKSVGQRQEQQQKVTDNDQQRLVNPHHQSAFVHQRHPFALKSEGTVSVHQSDDDAMPPSMDEQQQTMRRMPLQSMENAAMGNGRRNLTGPLPYGYMQSHFQLLSDGFPSAGHFSTPKSEPTENIPPKTRTGPPAHWRVEETEKRQKRSAKRVPFPKPTYQIDEQGRQVVVVRCDDSYRSNEDEDERMEGERGVPPVARNGFVKPAYSYSCLIGLSLKNSDTGELTVSEIYAFLCYHFPYFREAPSGWKNSVRHNLSLNKCFQKIEVETPGSQGRKSCLWRMNPQKCAKMDQELRKWRDRDERRILNAMELPQNLDALQNGTVGMPPNMKPRRFSIASTVVEECNQHVRIHPSSLQHPPQQHQSQLFVAHRSADPPPLTRRTSPPPQRPFDAVVTLAHQLPPQPILPQRNAAVVHHHPTHHRCAAPQNDASSVGSSDLRQRHSVHAQAARKLENLLQQKQIASEPVTDEAAGYFGGFTLIGGPSSGCGKKRRSSDNEFGSS